jgi:hypothetical protein
MKELLMAKRFTALVTMTILLFVSACSSLALQTESVDTPEVTSAQSENGAAIGNSPTGSAPQIPDAFQPARDDLAKELGISPNQIQVQSSEEVMWRDSCLGVVVPGEMCAQVITPGFRVVFTTPQGDIEYHTNQSGNSFRKAGSTVQLSNIPAIKPPLVEWKRTGGFAGICESFAIYGSGAYTLTNCNSGAPISKGKLDESQMSKLNDLAKRYGQVNWDSTPPQGSADVFMDSFKLYGNGSEKPSSETQQSINEMLASLAADLQTPVTPGPGTGESGIEGSVTIGPNCPGPAKPGSNDCASKPYQASFSVLSETNTPITQLQTDEMGHFHIDLAPGTYILHPESENTFPRASDQTVTVEKGKYTQVDIMFDTGIR